MPLQQMLNNHAEILNNHLVGIHLPRPTQPLTISPTDPSILNGLIGRNANNMPYHFPYLNGSMLQPTNNSTLYPSIYPAQPPLNLINVNYSPQPTI